MAIVVASGAAPACSFSVSLRVAPSPQTMLLHGSGPDTLSGRSFTAFFKYDSSMRQFKPLPSKGLSVQSDAVCLVKRTRRTSLY